MPIAWHQLRIPGSPGALKLSQAEQTAQDPEVRFARRMIQRLEFSRDPSADSARSLAAEQRDRLALIDKASPHALFDLMLAEVSPTGNGQARKTDASSVMPITGQVLWQTAVNFQRFVNSPEFRRELGLGDERANPGNNKAPMLESVRQSGWLQLALNCDPNTNDRESVQALKSFHLHLIYWQPSELSSLTETDQFRDQHDPYLARQCLDPLSFIGPRLLNDRLTDLETELGSLGARLLPADAASTCAGRRAMGCLIQLPSWDLLATCAFERLIRQLHRRLAETARALLHAVTGSEQPPAPWQRHQLLPIGQIAQNLEPLGLSVDCRADLLALTQQLRDLPPPLGQTLRETSPARRMHCMTLNQPCYSLSLSPMDAQGRSTMGADGPLLLSLQIKLFSGIGGAGLLSFPGLPSVRVLRGQGQFSPASWQRRAHFQRCFAAYNAAALMAQEHSETGSTIQLLDPLPNQIPDQILGRRLEQHIKQHSIRSNHAPGQHPSSAFSQASPKKHLTCGPVRQFQNATGWTD